jgi:hypothetical protein
MSPTWQKAASTLQSWPSGLPLHLIGPVVVVDVVSVAVAVVAVVVLQVLVVVMHVPHKTWQLL